MGNLPEINSIIHGPSILVTKNKRNLYYDINRGEMTRTGIHVELPEFSRPKISKEIVDNSNEFINGFKVVQTSNGEYAYIRQSDFLLLPFRYDVASDFNEYGFAIVGKNGNVSWIDMSFRYLDINGNMVEEELSNYARFNGWQGVSAFSQGTIPLSRVYDGRNSYGRVSYFGIDGKLKEFYQYDGQINYDFSEITFNSGTTFDENGQAMADEKILFAKGYSLSYRDLIKICKQKGYISSICEDAEKCFDKETGRVLKKEFNKTTEFKQSSEM